MEPGLRIGLEVGKKRTFASALDWPGWARSGRTEDDAIVALASYSPRYAVVAEMAGQPFDREVRRSLERGRFSVVGRVEGNATTDFGAPGVPFPWDDAPMSATEIDKTAALLEASWRLLTEILAKAPAELRKGPRGGGRDRDAIAAHVAGAEAAYARGLGLPKEMIVSGDPDAAVVLRQRILEAFRASASGAVPSGKWPARYAARRMTWHVLDHCWEIEDRGDLLDT